MDGAAPLLSVRQLSVRFDSLSEPAAPVNGVSFDVRRGSILALVGSSGSGKSLTALSILGLLPPGARSVAGEIVFEGRDLRLLPEAELQRVRGRKIAMIFQEPASALSPVHTVGWQLAMALHASGHLGPIGLFQSLASAGRSAARELLQRVELPDPEHVLDTYPHQLSAGMRRRVLIALALACRPTLLIADEPTTGLDAPIQAQILDLLARLTVEAGLSAIFITHDLCVAAEVASEVAVMLAGQVVEAGPTRRLFSEPRHPYTAQLLASIPGHQPFERAPHRASELAHP